MYKKFTLLIAAILLMTIAMPGTAKAWKEYTSENFIVISDQKTSKVKKRVLELEAYRASALLFLGLENRKDSTPAKIFIFDSEREFRLLTGNKSRIAGFYQKMLGGPVMVLSRLKRDEAEGEENLVLFHEFVHYLLRERSPLIYPRWYEEGLCDLLAATVIEDGKALIGQSNTWRHWAVKRHRYRVNTETLVATPPTERDNHYYQGLYQSGWLTTHYLLLGRFLGEPDYTAGLGQYLLAFSNGDMTLDTFEQALGVKARDFDKALRAYADNEKIVGVSIPVPKYKGGIKIRKLSKVESTYYHADLLEYADKESKAQYFLRKLKPSNDPFYPRTLSKLAIYEGHDENFDAAFKRLDQALKLAQNDYQILVDAGHIYIDYIKELDPKKPWNQEIQSLYDKGMHYAKRAHEHPDKNAEAPRHLRSYYELKDDTLGVVKMYMEQYAYTPNYIGLNNAIGKYLARLSKPELALPFLRKVVSFSHNEETIEQAANLIAKIEAGPKSAPAGAE